MISSNKIVVTDGGTINPGDLSWDELKDFGELTVYDKSTPEQYLDRVKDANIILTNKAVLYNELLNKLPNLEYVGVTATGYNVIDLEIANAKGITVTNVPGYGTNSVAQHVFAMILEFTNNVGNTSDKVGYGRWTEVGEWCYWDAPLFELADKTLGIVGLGAIGNKVAKIGSAFGMHICYFTPAPKEVEYEYADLETILEKSDYITLHCPLNDETNGLIDSERLGLMKKSAVLINTGRGQLVNEQHLAEALKNGTIAGAALDVLSQEPPEKNPLIGQPNCIITPHQAWATKEARQRLLNISIDNVRAYLNGKSQNVVN
ncbi:MAG: D-2-hydroxyacid dehydrogenase [Cyclobacteriaceae bacterium]